MNGAAVAAAAAAAIAKAIKASGVLVRVTPEDFALILARCQAPLVIVGEGGFFSTKYRYLVSYKGFGFYTQSGAPLPLPSGAEIITTKRIWIPGG